MKIRFLVMLALTLASSAFAAAADLAGRWTSKFDSQIGEQNYVFVFAHEGERLIGTATRETSMGNGETKLTNLKVDGKNVSFTEVLDIDGNHLTITYTGTLEGDALTLTRQVGEFATEHITAKRVTAKP